MFWWPWADIYPCPGVALERAKSSWRYFGSRALAERVWLYREQQGQSPPGAP